MLRFATKSFINGTNYNAASRLRCSRYFHACSNALAAKIYDMPAMSPTMESGAIVEWKVKEGEPYSSGDPLLDIETDKATISVDAIDDGILAKILLPDGTKEIPVGTPIAYIAEEGDDLATLEYPPLDTNAPSKPASSTETKAASPPPPPPPSTQPLTTSPASSSNAANPAQVFLPSVELMLNNNNISREDALAKIPATGPNGRILKGDVLAYFGKIPAAKNSSLAEYLKRSESLDLSNIELRDATSAANKESKEELAAKPKVKEPVTLTESYPVDLEISYPQMKSFKNAIAKAISASEQATYALNLNPVSDLDDPLFDDLIAPARNTDRFKIDYKLNIEGNEISTLDLQLTLNESCFDAKDRATIFVNKFKTNLSNHLKDF